MEILMYLGLVIAFSYLLGSIPFGKIIGLRQGIDIQKQGSGNIGFANAVRTLGWKPAVLVLIGDITKGFLPTICVMILLPGTPLAAMLGGAAAILGHIFPVWLKGRGGKGIATGLGVTLALNPFLALCAIFTYLTAFGLSKKSAPASLTAAWCLPIICNIVMPPFIYFYLCLALLATWTHRDNIRQMIQKGGHDAAR